MRCRRRWGSCGCSRRFARPERRRWRSRGCRVGSRSGTSRRHVRGMWWSGWRRGWGRGITTQGTGLHFPLGEGDRITFPTQCGKRGAKGQNRTADTTIFSRVLYRLSYLGRVWTAYRGMGVWGGVRVGGSGEGRGTSRWGAGCESVGRSMCGWAGSGGCRTTLRAWFGESPPQSLRDSSPSGGAISELELPRSAFARRPAHG